jgi:hypothetical protein
MITGISYKFTDGFTAAAVGGMKSLFFEENALFSKAGPKQACAILWALLPSC